MNHPLIFPIRPFFVYTTQHTTTSHTIIRLQKANEAKNKPRTYLKFKLYTNYYRLIVEDAPIAVQIIKHTNNNKCHLIA